MAVAPVCLHASDVARTAVVTLTSLCAGALVVVGLAYWQPTSDPVAVVGLPLIQGTSESTEQLSLYALGATTFAAAAAQGRRRGPEGGVLHDYFTTLVSAAILLGLVAWQAPASVFGLLVGVVVCGLAGAWAKPWEIASRETRTCCFGAAAAIATWVQPGLLVELGAWKSLGLLALLVLVECHVRRIDPRRHWISIGLRWLAAECVLALMVQSESELAWTSLGAATLAALALSRCPLLPWVTSLVATILTAFSAPPFVSIDTLTPLKCAIGGGAAAWMVLSLWSDAWNRGISWSDFGWASLWPPPAAVGLAVVWAFVVNPWTAIFVGMGLWVSHESAATGRFTRFGRRLGAVILLWCMFVEVNSAVVSRPVDPFHDGQRMSAVWEWESGRTLFDDVFPLRMTDFWLTWLAQRAAPDDYLAYSIAFALVAPLGPIGVYLLTLAGSGQSNWSFVTASVAGLVYPLDGRIGICLALVALVLWLARRRDWTSFLGIVAIAVLSAWLGFDTMATVAGSAAVGIAFRSVAGWRSILCGVASGGLFVAIAAAGFWTTTAVACGPGSANAYGPLFLEYSRYYPAFYGRPIEWQYPGVRATVALAATSLGAWLAASGLWWSRLAASQKQTAAVLAVAFVLTAQRGIGRSDLEHLHAVNYPSVVLASVLLWWITQGLAAADRRVAWVRAWILIGTGFVAAIIGLRAIGPVESIRTWQEARRHPTVTWPRPDPIIAEMLNPTDTLWEMEDALSCYVYRRHNPTRHSLAYCIGWPAEQRRAVESLRRRPPKLVDWKYVGPDGLSNPLRYYLISDYLFDHYAPMPNGGWLARVDAPWRGWTSEQGRDFGGLLRLGGLPYRWGEAWQTRIPSHAGVTPPMATVDPIVPRRRVALDVDITTERRLAWLRLAKVKVWNRNPMQRDDWRRMSLRIAGPGEAGLDDAGRIEFDVRCQEESAWYLVPVGCSPAWSWRERIARIELDGHDEIEFLLSDLRFPGVRLEDIVD